MSKPPLTILLAGPRGFCAGVDRAIAIVEQALEKYGAPVYVRHEIVHNRYVVEWLGARAPRLWNAQGPDRTPHARARHRIESGRLLRPSRAG